MTKKQMMKQIKQSIDEQIEQEKSKQDNKLPEKKIEFTKLLLVNVIIINYILLGFALSYMWINHDASMFDRLQIVWGTELATVTGFYVWKAKNENQLKIKGFYDMKINELNVNNTDDAVVQEQPTQFDSQFDFYSNNSFPYDSYTKDIIDENRYSDNI